MKRSEEMLWVGEPPCVGKEDAHTFVSLGDVHE